jgi:hypothetical protein
VNCQVSVRLRCLAGHCPGSAQANDPPPDLVPPQGRSRPGALPPQIRPCRLRAALKMSSSHCRKGIARTGGRTLLIVLGGVVLFGVYRITRPGSGEGQRVDLPEGRWVGES